MTFNDVILLIVAVGVILGGTDKLMGNRFGLGAKFEEGFQSMGCLLYTSACITDALAAMLAQGCLDKGDIKTTYGTGCFMYINLGDTVRYSQNGLITVSSWQVDNKICLLYTSRCV